MKVDLGQCAVCGAKNSKYVEKCYKCGATLPWAPDYVAPKNTPQPAQSQPAQPQPAQPQPAQSQPAQSQPVAPDNAKTVVVTPLDAAPDSASAPRAESQAATTPNVKQRAHSKIAVPAWAMVAGGLGLVVLGMGLWALLSPKPAATPPVIVAPTPAATSPALAPIAPAASATPAVTVATTPAATPLAQPSAAPTTAAVAGATNAPIAQPEATAVPATTAPTIGPTFDELYANLTTGTPQQQALYWESVEGRKINWRGEFVSLGSAATGPLIVNCKSAKGALKVTVTLDEATPQTLPQFTTRQSVPFSGILQNRNAGEIVVNGGRVN